MCRTNRSHWINRLTSLCGDCVCNSIIHSLNVMNRTKHQMETRNAAQTVRSSGSGQRGLNSASTFWLHLKIKNLNVDFSRHLLFLWKLLLKFWSLQSFWLISSNFWWPTIIYFGYFVCIYSKKGNHRYNIWLVCIVIAFIIAIVMVMVMFLVATCSQLCLRLSWRKYVIIRIDRVLFISIMVGNKDDVRVLVYGCA